MAPSIGVIAPMLRPLRIKGPGGPYISLFWRLFIPNACVLSAACVVLIVEPANGRVVALVGGLTVMLAANVLLMRRAFGPLLRLISLMGDIDPLRPGQRIPALGPASEVAVLQREFNAMLDRIETERRDSARRAAAGQEAERRHVATELHDEVGQTLTALVLELDHVAARGSHPDRDLEQAKAAATAALEDVRRLARRLRPEVLDELGLVPALTNLCDRFSQRSGLVIRRTLDPRLDGLGPETELVIYRVAQESLTNVARHARAREAHVRLEQGAEAVELTVDDDGIGFDMTDAAAATGVRGMRERAILVGGQLAFERSPGGGTRVRLRVPAAEAFA